MRKCCYLPIGLILLVLCGCDRGNLSSDEEEERDPLVKTGAAYVEQERWDEAEAAFREALDLNPMMARPHLDLALIYQQHKTNYVYAIYHYDRYLELRPDSEKAVFIRDQRQKVKRALEISIIQQSPEVRKVVADAQQLMKENEALRKQLAASASTSTTTTPAGSEAASEAASGAPTSAASSETPAQGHQIYTVMAGDTLTRIAAKFYGESGSWEPIYEANRDSLSSPSSLRVGQTLVIPNQ